MRRLSHNEQGNNVTDELNIHHLKKPLRSKPSAALATLYRFTLVLVCLLVMPTALTAAAEATRNANNHNGQQLEGPFAIKIYQKYISGIDGDRCSMYPSCSHYSSQAIKTHGWFKGWIMTCDRLIRCGRDESKFSHPVMVNGRLHTYDPVDRNDIWKANPHATPTVQTTPE